MSVHNEFECPRLRLKQISCLLETLIIRDVINIVVLYLTEVEEAKVFHFQMDDFSQHTYFEDISLTPSILLKPFFACSVFNHVQCSFLGYCLSYKNSLSAIESIDIDFKQNNTLIIYHRLIGDSFFDNRDRHQRVSKIIHNINQNLTIINIQKLIPVNKLNFHKSSDSVISTTTITEESLSLLF